MKRKTSRRPAPSTPGFARRLVLRLGLLGHGGGQPYLWITESEEDPDKFLACVYVGGPDGEEAEDPFLLTECGGDELADPAAIAEPSCVRDGDRPNGCAKARIAGGGTVANGFRGPRGDGEGGAFAFGSCREPC